jgi:hypothetical protein
MIETFTTNIRPIKRMLKLQFMQSLDINNNHQFEQLDTNSSYTSNSPII